MKQPSEMSLRELVKGFRLSIDKIADIQDEPVVDYEYVSEMLGEIEHLLPALEAAVELAEAALNNQTAQADCIADRIGPHEFYERGTRYTNAQNAYRAAKEAERNAVPPRNETD